jgi:hypothetical protein
MIPETSVEGYWQVGGKKFVSKFEALVTASRTYDKQLTFHYFDEVWDSFDKSVLGKLSLNQLYRIRAQQIRDEYDYLIVYFSGGADSHNVIRSFVDNDIKLDEVCVKWPMSAIKAGVYIPDAFNLEPRNTLSEWDFAIKPKLDWLSREHPDVKITIVDWSEDLSDKTYTEELFKKVNNYNDVEIPFMTAYSESEKQLVEKGKKVASIYGIEKPKVGRKDGKWYMHFLDQGTAMGTPSEINRTGTEYFYWTPKFPILAYQQAHDVCRYLDSNKQLKRFFPSEESASWDIPTRIQSLRMQNSICREVLYTTWDNAFQPFKPDIPDRADKHFWIFEHPELVRARDAYLDMNSLFLDQINPWWRFGISDDQNPYKKTRGIYRMSSSKWFFVKFEE